MRKNLSDITSQDLLLKWQYEDTNGADVYAIHAVADYRVTSHPLGTLTFIPKSKLCLVDLRKELKGRRLQASGPLTDD